MLIVIILWIGGGEDNSNPAIHKAKKKSPQSTKRVGHRHKRGLILGISGPVHRMLGDQYIGCKVMVLQLN